ncbi:MAG: aldo/keto reductase, partial [Christensenellales bacterium]
MKKLLLGNRLQSAPIALGCMRIARMDDADAERLIRTALDCGIDLFDHADIYGGGESERVFARVLKRNPGIRESML